ncbi:coiled-coil domain-containing protein 13-like isoform X2 [Patiria miniata]|uniref:Coiled-coil domain-containing protein 13 n=1 Tax=Patiria miniata TaxID=46514 RepID=A0A914BRF5_PATMI|nr:coiled-coil domain-containing protein 13-like isoform X2 [Patiria miniata]
MIGNIISRVTQLQYISWLIGYVSSGYTHHNGIGQFSRCEVPDSRMETADETLRQQFQALQEQQQRKLTRRKQKQEEKNKKEAATKEQEGKGGAKKKKEGEELGGLGLNDDLDLKLSEPVSNDTAYNEELNQRLNEQIRELKDETGRLYKLLSERDYEIRKLKKQREEDRLALGGGGVASDSAATKIVELSKKNRELTAELESDRTKVKQLMRKVRDTEKELAAALQQSQNGESRGKSSHQRSALTKEQSQDQAEAMAAEVKTLQDSLAKSQAKQTDFRNQVNILKQELKVAHKVLVSELGDNVNIQSIKNDSSSWRGRAQQILLLQNKVSELNRQLDQFKSRPGTQMSLEEQFMTMDVSDDRSSLTSALPRSSKGGGGGGTMDERQKLRLRQQEKGRREEQEKAVLELKALEEDHGKLKEKFEASKARNKVLANEVKSVKQQLNTLLDKGKHDNELIEALLSQQSQLQKHLEQSSKQHQEAQKMKAQASQEMQLRSQQDANTVEQLRLILKEKEAKVRQLEETVQEMSTLQQQRIQLNGYTDTPPDRPQSRPLTVISVDRPATSDRHSGLSFGSPAPPQSRQGTRPPSGSRSASKLSNGDGSGRVSSRGVRPSSTGSMTSASGEGSEEWRRQLQQYKSLCQVAEVERDKLMELVQILQNRADDANIKTTEAQASLQELKQRNVWLEKQLGKVKVESGSNSGKGTKKSSASATKAASSGSYITDGDLVKGELALSQQTLDELQTRLAIKIDENDALKSAVKSTLKVKEEDLKLYHDMMRQTKEVFLQGLRQFRQNGGNNS